MTNYSLFQKLVPRIKFILGFFFVLALVSNVSHHYFFRFRHPFFLSIYQWELIVMSVLIFVNMKGIKPLVLLLLTYFSVLATIGIFTPGRSGYPYGLLLGDLFSQLSLDSSIVYFIHMIIYIMLCWLMFIKQKGKNNQLLDQE